MEEVMNLENTSVIEIPAQRKINYAGIVLAILAILLAFVGIYMAYSVGNDTILLAESTGKAFKAVKTDFEHIHIKLSTNTTTIADLSKAVGKLESKSVVESLAKELREGKASKTSVDILRYEVLLKADAKTVKRLARRLNGFNTRLTTIEGIPLSK